MGTDIAVITEDGCVTSFHADQLKDGCKVVIRYFLKILQNELEVNDSSGIRIGESYETSTACIQQALEKRLHSLTELDDLDVLYLVKKSVHQCTRENDYSLENFMDILSAEIKGYLSIPRAPYILLTTLSLHPVSPTDVLGSVRYGGATISFPERTLEPEKYPEELREMGEKDFYSVFPKDYSFMRVHVRARNPRKAFRLAMRKSDEIRAIWNLAFNYRREMHRIGGRQAYNRIVYGPYYTLHTLPDGDSSGGFWVNTDWIKSTSAHRLNQVEHKRMKVFEAHIRKHLQANPHREFLKQALVAYVQALDEPNPENYLLRLWALLERLTAVQPQEKQTEVSRRAAFHYRNRKYHQYELELLRKHRNKLVHESKAPDETSALHYQRKLKGYVEHLLMFLIMNGAEFHTIDEFGWYLRQPTDLHLVKRRINYMEMLRDILEKD